MSASASDPVAEALEQALNGPKEAETQSATEPSPEAKPATAPSDAKVKGTEETVESKDDSPKTIPYDRFSEVVSQKNDAFDKVKSLESMFQGATEREDALRNRVTELEQDHQILDAIRNLAGDERYRTHVMAIDKALQGIDEEIEEAKSEGDPKAVEAAESRFNQKVSELEDLISDQNAEQLWQVVDAEARSMLDALPEEYTDVDKARLGQMWTPLIEWDHIEEEGREAITPHLRDTFAKLIKVYDTPQGAVVKQTREDTLKDVPQAVDANLTAEQRVEKIFGENWSSVDEKGKAEKSDAEFSESMADLIRATRVGDR